MMAPHEVLGLPADANEDEILTVRRVLVRKAQPEAMDPTDADAQMKAIDSACEAMLASLAANGRVNLTVDYTARSEADTAFQAPHRMVPSRDMQRKMEALLQGHLHRTFQDPVTRPSNALPQHASVDRVDFVENTLRLRLDHRPAPGRIVIAVPRFVQDDVSALRPVAQTALIEIDLPTDADGTNIRLSQAGARKCVEQVRDVAVEIQLPS